MISKHGSTRDIDFNKVLECSIEALYWWSLEVILSVSCFIWWLTHEFEMLASCYRLAYLKANTS